MTADRSDKSFVVALLLFFFLGIFGLHRYYVGKIGTATLQLACFLLGILGWYLLAFSGNFFGLILAGVSWGALTVWSLIDFILLVAQRFTDGEGKVLRIS